MKVSERLAKMLTETITLPGGVVFSISSADLGRHNGPYPNGDDHVGAWDGTGLATWPDGSTMWLCLGSYDTMTKCVRNGITWSWRGGRPFCGGIDVHAISPK